jgi:hypothetical protein
MISADGGLVDVVLAALGLGPHQHDIDFREPVLVVGHLTEGREFVRQRSVEGVGDQDLHVVLLGLSVVSSAVG